MTGGIDRACPKTPAMIASSQSWDNFSRRYEQLADGHSKGVFAMQEQIRKFLDFLAVEQGYSENTIAAYRNDLSQFNRFLTEMDPPITSWAEIKKDNIVNYILHLKERE